MPDRVKGVLSSAKKVGFMPWRVFRAKRRIKQHHGSLINSKEEMLLLRRRVSPGEHVFGEFIVSYFISPLHGESGR